MLKPKKEELKVKVQQNVNKGTVVIDSGSIVYDNKWISYKGTTFNFEEYVSLIVDGTTRRKFFQKKDYAVQLVIGIDLTGAIKVIEGKQVYFMSKNAVPIPTDLDMVPLVSVLYIQDGSTDLTTGYKPLNSSSITYFSGFGNISQKNLQGVSNTIQGATGSNGIQGVTGNKGEVGDQGVTGPQGLTGYQGISIRGEQGAQGMTGINWDINVPFVAFF